MHRLLAFLKNIFNEKASQIYPWHFIREFENSLNIIEDLNQIGDNFIGRLKEIVPCKKLILFIYDKDLGKYKVNTFLGIDEAEVSKIELARNDRLVKWLKVNQTYFNINEHPGVFNYLTEKERDIICKLEIKLSYPLISMNRLIGIIFLGGKENKKKYTKHELSLIASLTPQIGIALENAILYKEQKERFRMMSRVDKLATVGELAAGAAHEIRNPLTVIKSSLQYLNARIHTEKEQKLLTNALNETERIDEILSALLSFARPAEIKKKKEELIEILKESLELITLQANNHKVKIREVFPVKSLYLKGDKSQLKQLFLNLFLNSIQAMKEGGELKVEVSALTNNEVLVSISDTGEGIPEKDLDRIFDPFFTTKKGGTGLGLSICYGIAKSHNGEIEVKSRLNLGTTALIKLPLLA